MIIGIFGKIASGKSYICKKLEEKYNFLHINADSISKEVLQDNDILRKIYEYDNSVFYKGKIDKNKLRSKIFSSQEYAYAINSIMWPKISQIIKDEVLSSNNQNIVIEAALLPKLDLPFIDCMVKVEKKYLINLFWLKIRDKRKMKENIKILKLQDEVDLFKFNFKVKSFKQLEKVLFKK